ncbi:MULTISPECIES: hypothetical protein [Acinetobacter]|jgi:hypothetical protein|uniref:Uncharacterized protein n=1 Tax=Acinetobacter albensis TaxID=1673609 RepID=A0ABW9JVD0_9GAMM|nr:MULTISPECIES: hypothetical protein [Acinetobacter calcoaceticus/baumannii complex]EXE26594.1 hypothetical protein J569_1884 [Acinetobacter sp. 907131]MDP7815418.1 hypothetical protein [Acinetobacter pittii]RQN78181.1 hypothetical protein EAH71_00535 [Acinetobacter baumannii]
MAKVLKDFQRRLAKVETHRKNKATTIKLVAAFPPILSYDEWEAIAVPHQQQLVDDTKHN